MAQLESSDLDLLEAIIRGDYNPPRRDPFDIKAAPLFGGLSGVPLPKSELQLGYGITLRRTYAKLNIPHILAFAPPLKPSAPDPGPWAAVGEKSMLMLAEVELLGEPSLGFDRINTLWFVVCLLRLKLALPVRMPVLADRPFQNIPNDVERANIIPLEVHSQQLLTAPPATRPAEADFEWLRDNILAASELMKDSVFNRAFQTLDGAIYTQDPGAAIVIAWAAIETLLRPGNSKITERICRALAVYLHPPGPDRDRDFAVIVQCYAARGGAAHAGTPPQAEQFHNAFRLARSALLQTIERRQLPEIEALLEAWRSRNSA